MNGKERPTITAEPLLEQAFDAIRERKLDQAAELLDQALSVDFDDKRVLTALKFLRFWQDREERVQHSAHEYERGEYLLDQWPMFEEFSSRFEECEPGMQAVRQYVFGTALDAFLRLLKESDPTDPELLLRIGRCHKGLGSYDLAVRYLEASAAEKPNDAEVTAELADAYALVNETQAAKAFFREAFFLDPQQVHLEMLESQMIRALVDKTTELGVLGAELLEWIPVYGVLFGVFNVKRELRSIEYGKLKQSIYALERELREGRSPRAVIEPRLINHYFWLIDHYICSGENTVKVDEVLLKLRSVNDRIYKMYTN
jgi:tetratricopeptide (TPR) repeat protein